LLDLLISLTAFSLSSYKKKLITFVNFSSAATPHSTPYLIDRPLGTVLLTNTSAVEKLITSSTLDPIPRYLLKTLLPSLIHPITHIINRSLANMSSLF